MWIATVTTAANSQSSEPRRDTEASKAKAAAAAAAKRKSTLAGSPAQPLAHNVFIPRGPPQTNFHNHIRAHSYVLKERTINIYG